MASFTSYCVKCKSTTPAAKESITVGRDRLGRARTTSKCHVCGTIQNRYLPKDKDAATVVLKGAGFLGDIVNAVFPF